MKIGQEALASCPIFLPLLSYMRGEMYHTVEPPFLVELLNPCKLCLTFQLLYIHYR